MSNVTAIFQNNAILISFDGTPHTIDDSNPNYDDIFNALKVGNFDEAKRLCQLSFEIINWGDEELTVQGGEITFKGMPLGERFTKRILQMINENQDREPLKNFLRKLFKNPSNRSIEQVPEFIYVCDLPITKEGNILTYKKVTDDFKDCRTKTIDNSPGQVVKEDRRLISDDPTQTCDRGLHVCSWGYLDPNECGMFSGGKLIVCEVSPEHIVCVPTDYKRTKMRVCEYKVLEEYVGKDPRELYERESVWSKTPDNLTISEPTTSDASDVASSYDDDDDDEYEEDFDDYDEEIDDVDEDYEEDVEQKHALREKAKAQFRDEKGRFIKKDEIPQVAETVQAAPTPVRDVKGRFVSKVRNFLKG